jgi:patatin-like phospholipase/acyl hydrolase
VQHPSGTLSLGVPERRNVPFAMRVLSIDGGGIRGIVPATVLAALEERTGRPVCDLFDLIGGTSTGGILALALTRPGGEHGPRWSAAEIVALYREEGPRIFSRSLGKRITSVDGLLDERYSNRPLREVLERYLGETTVDQALTDVFVTTYDLQARKPKFFKSWREDAGLPMAVAAEATAAAPTYFEPVAVGDAALIDGGVFAGNPAMCAYAEAVRLWPNEAITVVSLGTGSQTRPIPLSDARGWGVLEWARPIIDVVFDGSSDAVDYQLEHVLAERYVRLQTRLEGANDDMDDASAANVAALERVGAQLVAENAAVLDRLAAELAA